MNVSSGHLTAVPSPAARVDPVRTVALLYPEHMGLLEDGRLLDDVLRTEHPGLHFTRSGFLTHAARITGRPDLVDPSGLREALREADAVICQDLPDDVLNLAPRLRWVQTINTGVEHIPVEALRERGVTVSNAQGTSAPEIAEFVLARLLEHVKCLPTLAAQQTSGTWLPQFGRSVSSLTVGLVGLGAINKEVAWRVTSLGAQVRIARRSGPDEHTRDRAVYPLDRLTDLAAGSDILVVALPDHPSLRHLVDARVLAALPTGALAINVGRGATLDHDALLAELRAGRIAAALDVTEPEPLPPDSPLWQHARISPHCSSNPRRSITRLVELFAENLALIDGGHAPSTVVD